MCNSRGGGRGFLCPQGTRFNQRTMVCDFAKKVKCNDASDFFHRNVIIHEASLAATKRKTKQQKPTKPSISHNFSLFWPFFHLFGPVEVILVDNFCGVFLTFRLF